MPLLFSERLANFDELLRLQCCVDVAVLGPEVKELRQAISRRDIGVIVRSTEDLEIALEHASNRIGVWR